MSDGAAIWLDAATAAALFAVDPAGTGGVLLRAGAGPVRDRWLDSLRKMLSPEVPFRKLPTGVSEARLLGGIDLAATLQAGRPVAERGLLAEVDGGVLLAVMAERLSGTSVAHLNAAIDAGEVVVERDGLSLRVPSSFGVVAFDEGIADDERAPASLADRLAFHLDLTQVARGDLEDDLFGVEEIAAARDRLRRVKLPDDAIEALCATAAALGIGSLRAVMLASRVARVAAALDAKDVVGDDALKCAARLVLAPRATVLPAPPDQDQEPEPDKPDEDTPEDSKKDNVDDLPLEDLVLQAAQAAIPLDLLKRLQEQSGPRRHAATSGKQGLAQKTPKRGRPVGSRRGELRAGARLNVLETLRVAAPWQGLRRRTRGAEAATSTRVIVHKDDFRITRFKEKSGTTTLFVVDASGSSALQRLAEVKGAVELLLADCYVRRDEVALIAFRGQSAELLLPPTRSLARAKRSLAALPGGGGTPLSAAIIAATELALAIRSKGQAPTIVLMTDGRANVSRDGSGGRPVAEAEALTAAKQLAGTGIPVVLVDSSPRPQAQAQKLATEMRARYVALPYADAARLSQAVQANMRAG